MNIEGAISILAKIKADYPAIFHAFELDQVLAILERHVNET